MNVRLRRIALLASAAALVGLILLLPGALRSDSSGCSRMEDRRAALGRCAPSAGDTCYHCEYARSGGGYSVCGENESGEVSLCIDYDDIPF